MNQKWRKQLNSTGGGWKRTEAPPQWAWKQQGSQTCLLSDDNNDSHSSFAPQYTVEVAVGGGLD